MRLFSKFKSEEIKQRFIAQIIGYSLFLFQFQHKKGGKMSCSCAIHNGCLSFCLCIWTLSVVLGTGEMQSARGEREDSPFHPWSRGHPSALGGREDPGERRGERGEVHTGYKPICWEKKIISRQRRRDGQRGSKNHRKEVFLKESEEGRKVWSIYWGEGTVQFNCNQ